jgi:xylitol oxidase
VQRNWAGNVRYRAAATHRPTSVAEISQLVAHATKIKAIGTAHSFSRVADTTGDLVSVAGLPHLIDIDSERATVSVSAGIRYGELSVALHRAGFALANLASLPHLSVAGACATGTHGSGVGQRGLASAVSAVEMVTATGDVVTLRHDPGAVVALGALGIVTRLELDIVPTFDIAQTVYEDVPRDRLDELLGGGYSVSLFTDWRDDTITHVWRKRVATEATGDETAWLGARVADRPRHPVPGGPAGNCTDQQGVPGPWHLRLPHFRLEFTPSAGDELQSEYLVGREMLPAALAAIRSIGDRVAPILHVSEIRTVAADDLWLSPAYGRDSAAIHFTWHNHPDRVNALLPDLEDRLGACAARPHWGKVFAMDPAVVRERYPRLVDFVDLMRAYDPAGAFRNDFLDRYFPE